MFQFKTRGESEKVFRGLRPSYKHPRATKLKQDTNATFARKHYSKQAATMTFKLEYLQQNLAECATFFSSKYLKESIPKIRYQQEALKYYIQTQTVNSDEQQVLVQWLYKKSQTQSDTVPTENSKLVHDISALTSNKMYMIQKHAPCS